MALLLLVTEQEHVVKVPAESQFIEDWFSPRELNKDFQFDSSPEGLENFWTWITGGPQVEVRAPDALIKARKYFRGQTKSWHGFTSSLYRVCKEAVGDNVQVDEVHLASAEQAVISALREEGMGRRMSDGELLMVCQHHLVPTRLIDVSTQPLEALFFAVEKEDGTDGRLFVVAPHQAGSGLPQARSAMRLTAEQRGAGEASTLDSHPLPWVGAVRGHRQARDHWSVEVHLIDDEPLDPRMRAQAGKFLVGGVHRAYGGFNMAGISSIQRPDITCLAINFRPSPGPNSVAQAWAASGWSVRIHAEWKSELRRRLGSLEKDYEMENITVDSMYPPIAHIERLGKFVAKQGVGEWIHSHR